MHPSSQAVPIEVFAGTALQAGFVKSLLENAGIIALLQDEYVGTLSPWWVDGGGAGAVKVMVPYSQAEISRQVVAAYLEKIEAGDD